MVEKRGGTKAKVMEKIDCAVVGGGVIGLAVARALALAGREVLLLEQNAALGEETSARNSEVIHAGIYYEPGSLKARLCVEGGALLYRFCQAQGVPHKKLGKLIVATQESQLPALAALKAKAAANGVTDLTFLTASEARSLESALHCVGALLSPSTGILDSRAYMLALQGEAEAAGALVVLRAPVIGGAVTADGLVLQVGGAEPMALQARAVVNAAGHGAHDLLRKLAGFPPASVPRLVRSKGNYFTLSGAAPFQHLIYPAPVAGGLGTHLTLDMAGQARFGPDVEWLPEGAPLDYAVDPRRADSFYQAIRCYWPALPEGSLQAAYSGIRPKLSGPGEAAADFLIQDASMHGVPHLVNLLGIESPGLTSSLAIAELVARQLAAV